jgi:hypothetical protein
MHGPGGLSHGVARSRLPGAASVAERYRRVAEPAVRGVAGVAVTVALFAAAGAVGGRGGAAIAGPGCSRPVCTAWPTSGTAGRRTAR